MIRHTSVDVPRGTCYGWADVPLNASFPDEAAETLRQLQEITRSEGPFQAVFTSPLSRARRLAAFCGYPDAEADERLKEMYMGQWEMKRFSDIRDDALQMWFDDYMHLRTTGGEGFPDLLRRVGLFLDELRRKPLSRVAIFAHGGVLLTAGIHARLFPQEGCFQHHVPFGALQRFSL